MELGAEPPPINFIEYQPAPCRTHVFLVVRRAGENVNAFTEQHGPRLLVMGKVSKVKRVKSKQQIKAKERKTQKRLSYLK